jgi:hypothetical protein
LKLGRKVVWIAVAIAVLVAVCLICVRVFLKFGERMMPMSVHDRVTKVVQVWAHMPTLPDDKQELEVIWDTSGLHYEFFPYGAQDLTTKLQREFRESKRGVLEFTDIYATNNTSGKVKTVEELAIAVRQNYRPQ